MKLNKAGQEEARRRADGILKYAKDPKHAAYLAAVHALGGRNQREWRITDLVQEIVEREAK